MPASLNIKYFANNVDGALGLKQFILDNSAGPMFAVDALAQMDESSIESGKEQGKEYLGCVLCCIYPNISEAYASNVSGRIRRTNGLFANGGIFISASNIEARADGATDLIADFHRKLYDHYSHRAASLFNDIDDHAIVPDEALMNNISAQIEDKAKEKKFNMFNSLSVGILSCYNNDGFCMYVSADVAIKKLSENCEQYIKDDTNAMWRIVQDCLDARIMQSFKSHIVSSIIEDSQAVASNALCPGCCTIS